MRYVRVFYDAMLIFYRKHFPRFNLIFYPIVKLGVMVRAGMSMAKRMVKRLIAPQVTPRDSESWPWVIISDQAQDVANRAGISDYTKALPESGRCNVLLDDGCYDCAQIVDYLLNHSDSGHRAYHIFASRHGTIISPKMS